MLRRRYHQKEKIAGKTEGREKTYASVRNRADSERGIYRCAEDGLVNYHADDGFPYPVRECLSFTGHRVIPEADRRRLSLLLPERLEAYYREGIRVFLSGGALGFDTLASEAVLRLRERHPEVRLIIAVPCRSQSARWSPEDRRVYDHLLKSADEVRMISEEYYPGCMQKRNLFLVDHADVCICYLRQCRGGTWNTVSSAYDRGLKIDNLALRL